MLWDRVLQSREESRIEELIDTEYNINDNKGQLRGQQIKISFHYDVMPIIGMLEKGEQRSQPAAAFMHEYAATIASSRC